MKIAASGLGRFDASGAGTGTRCAGTSYTPSKTRAHGRRPPVDDGRAHPLRRARVAAAARALAARALGGGGGGGGGGVGSDEALHARQDRVALASPSSPSASSPSAALGSSASAITIIVPWRRETVSRLVLRRARRRTPSRGASRQGCVRTAPAALPTAVAPAVVLAGGARHRRLPRLRLAQRAAPRTHSREELDGEPPGQRIDTVCTRASGSHTSPAAAAPSRGAAWRERRRGAADHFVFARRDDVDDAAGGSGVIVMRVHAVDVGGSTRVATTVARRHGGRGRRRAAAARRSWRRRGGRSRRCSSHRRRARCGG